MATVVPTVGDRSFSRVFYPLGTCRVHRAARPHGPLSWSFNSRFAPAPAYLPAGGYNRAPFPALDRGQGIVATSWNTARRVPLFSATLTISFFVLLPLLLFRKRKGLVSRVFHPLFLRLIPLPFFMDEPTRRADNNRRRRRRWPGFGRRIMHIPSATPRPRGRAAVSINDSFDDCGGTTSNVVLYLGR